VPAIGREASRPYALRLAASGHPGHPPARLSPVPVRSAFLKDFYGLTENIPASFAISHFLGNFGRQGIIPGQEKAHAIFPVQLDGPLHPSLSLKDQVPVPMQQNFGM